MFLSHAPHGPGLPRVLLFWKPQARDPSPIEGTSGYTYPTYVFPVFYVRLKFASESCISCSSLKARRGDSSESDGSFMRDHLTITYRRRLQRLRYRAWDSQNQLCGFEGFPIVRTVRVLDREARARLLKPQSIDG